MNFQQVPGRPGMSWAHTGAQIKKHAGRINRAMLGVSNAFLIKCIAILCCIIAAFTLIPKSGMKLELWIGEQAIEGTFSPTSQDIPADKASLINGDVHFKKHKVNPQAPKTEAEIPEQDAKAFIDRWAETARREMRRTGVPASVSLAQGLCESGAGTSYLSKNANNYFGVKCFSKTCKAGHCINRPDDTHKDFFMKYSNGMMSWREHSNHLCKGRYVKLHKCGKDWRSWVKGLQKAGYATDPSYANSLTNLIKKHHLDTYDN